MGGCPVCSSPLVVDNPENHNPGEFSNNSVETDVTNYFDHAVPNYERKELEDALDKLPRLIEEQIDRYNDKDQKSSSEKDEY